MTNYELVRNKVIEAVPEIMNLEFGCKIHRPYDMYKYGFIIGEDNGSFYILYDRISQIINMEHDIQDYEIIGREIRLSDVLRAVDAEFLVRDGKLVTWCFRKPNMADHGEVEIWNLSHDSLEWHRDNRPETIDFLAEVLK